LNYYENLILAENIYSPRGSVVLDPEMKSVNKRNLLTMDYFFQSFGIPLYEGVTVVIIVAEGLHVIEY
jgi:hypothetical protein